MSAHPTMQGAPTLVLQQADAPSPSPAASGAASGGGFSWGSGLGLLAIAALVALIVIARKRGWAGFTVTWPTWRMPSDPEQCERAFGSLAKGLGVGHGEVKVLRRMAQELGVEPVALLICPSALDRGAEALKRTWSTAEHYLERDLATLSALEQKLGMGAGTP